MYMYIYIYIYATCDTGLTGGHLLTARRTSIQADMLRRMCSWSVDVWQCIVSAGSWQRTRVQSLISNFSLFPLLMMSYTLSTSCLISVWVV